MRSRVWFPALLWGFSLKGRFPRWLALRSSGQSLWLLIMRSRVWFPALRSEFSLKGKIPLVTSLVVYWSGSLTTNHEVPGSIPGSTVGIFLEGEDPFRDHGLGRLVQFRFKAPPGTTSSSITSHTPSGQRSRASWASRPQKSVTLLPCPWGRPTNSTKYMWWHWTKKRIEDWSVRSPERQNM